MFRCPKCHFELPADATFCTRCGFNRTNARMMAVKEQGRPAQAQPPASHPAPPQPGMGAAGVQPVRNSTPPRPQGNVPPQQAGSLRSFAGPGADPQKGGPPAQRPPQPGMPQNPMPPQGWNNQGQGRPSEQIVRTSTPPNANRPAAPPPARPPKSGVREGLWDGLSLDDLYNDPSMMMTSQAAEHWRESWRMRQKAEAGPAIGINRGQAEVPEPLLAMQHSIARMRAVMKTHEKPPVDRSKGRAFWLPTILMTCIIVGLIGYVATTFSNSGSTTSLAAPALHPNLLVSKTATTTFTAGQDIQVIGDSFSPNSTVTLSLDSANADGQTQGVQSSKTGTISTALTVPSSAQAGSYTLKAVDNKTKAISFLPVHVLPSSTANTTPLQATGADQLNFTVNTTNPISPVKKITLTNPTDATVTWSVTTFNDYVQGDPKKPPIGTDSTDWLVSGAHTSGQIAAQGTDELSINADAMNMASTLKGAKPYSGYVVINTTNAQNQQGQMILKASLTVTPTGNEIIVTPSTTLVVGRTADGNCVNSSITIANLGNTTVSYSVKLEGDATGNFSIGDNQADGKVLPAGSTAVDPNHPNAPAVPTDVQVITISCHNVQAGDGLYHIDVYPGTPQPIRLGVSVQAVSG
ncbi:MAG TPA: hypothetical protein VL485_21025 [Ktedonobacteraceae bacterium]|nr:hypothetical protein [Ktedonobacteraceae bacterium]